MFAHNQVIFQGEGGGIYMSDSQCILNGYTTFHNNSATGHRGVLCAIDGNVVLQDANFTQNSGGALYCARTDISYLGKLLKTQHQMEHLLHYSAPSTSETKPSLLEIQLSTVVVQCS